MMIVIRAVARVDHVLVRIRVAREIVHVGCEMAALGQLMRCATGEPMLHGMESDGKIPSLAREGRHEARCEEVHMGSRVEVCVTLAKVHLGGFGEVLLRSLGEVLLGALEEVLLRGLEVLLGALAEVRAELHAQDHAEDRVMVRV